MHGKCTMELSPDETKVLQALVARLYDRPFQSFSTGSDGRDDALRVDGLKPAQRVEQVLNDLHDERLIDAKPTRFAGFTLWRGLQVSPSALWLMDEWPSLWKGNISHGPWDDRLWGKLDYPVLVSVAEALEREPIVRNPQVGGASLPPGVSKDAFWSSVLRLLRAGLLAGDPYVEGLAHARLTRQGRAALQRPTA